MKKLRSYFITGLIAILPIFFTLFILIKIFEFFFNALKSIFPVENIIKFLNYVFPTEHVHIKILTLFLVYILSGLGILAMIFMVGVFTVHIIDMEKMKYFENVFMKIPLAKPIYSTLKEISRMVFSQNENAYKKVVIVEYPRKGIYSIGFVTKEHNECFAKELCEKNIKLVNVFVPTSPNPTSGMFLMFNKEELIELDMRIDDAIKLIISGGAISPKSIQEEGI